MVLPVIAIIGGTIIASLVPFFFPTPAENATVELNEKLGSGQFQLQKIRTTTGDDQPLPFNLDSKKIFLIVVVAIIVIMVVVMR